MVRIPLSEICKYRIELEKYIDSGELSPKFTFEHIKATNPTTKINPHAFLKMRVYGFIEKIGRKNGVIVYCLSKKYSRTHYNKIKNAK